MILSRFLKQFILIITVLLLSEVWANTKFTPEDVQKGLDIALAEVQTKYPPVRVYESDFLFFGDSMIINPHGTHYVFSYRKGNNYVTRLDKSYFHGHNFGRSLFKQGDNLFAFGGYGFWQAHSKLLRYNWADKEWDLIHLKGKLPKTSPALCFQQGDSLFAIYSYSSLDHFQDSFQSSKCFIIDLKKLVVQRIEYGEENEILRGLHQYQTVSGNWSVWGANHMISQIYNKVTKELYVNFSGPWPFRGIANTGSHQDSNWLLPEGDVIQIYTKGRKFDKISIPQFVQLYCRKIGSFSKIKAYVKKEPEKTESKVNKMWTLALAIILTLLILIIGILIATKKIIIGRSNSKFKEYYSELNNTEHDFKALFQLYFGKYSEKELDIALQIYHLPNEIRTLKRSQLLFELNQMRPGFIQRKIHPNKPNQFIYEIKNY